VDQNKQQVYSELSSHDCESSDISTTSYSYIKLYSKALISHPY